MQSESGRLRIEFGEALFGLTAKPFGNRAVAWKAWYAEKGEGFVLPSEEQVAAARVLALDREARERSNAARFFGIPVHSERVIFIVDVSGSMKESLRGRYSGKPGEVRLVRAKFELSAAVRDFPSTAQFNILAFSSGVSQWADRFVGVEEAPARRGSTRLGLTIGSLWWHKFISCASSGLERSSRGHDRAAFGR